MDTCYSETNDPEINELNRLLFKIKTLLKVPSVTLLYSYSLTE